MSLAGNIGGEELGQETSMTKVGIAAFIGALVEWYDYFLYGLAASVVFTQLFGSYQLRLGLPGHGVFQRGSHRRTFEGSCDADRRCGPDDLVK